MNNLEAGGEPEMPKHTFVCAGAHTHALCSIDEELVKRRPQLRLMRPAVLI